LAQVVVGSDVHRGFEDAGWVSARPGEADTEFQIASVSRALRAARGMLPPVVPEVSRGTAAGPAWLAGDDRALAHRAAALGVLEGPDDVVFAAVAADPAGRAEPADRADRDPLIAKARAGFGADWVGITDVWVSADHRRRGLAVAMMAELLEWGAELGATTAYVQTRGDNPAALALYERLGFQTHHSYRYLTPRS
jgi:ribosomal protein S18 acetylase RimI-like enzyme